MRPPVPPEPLASRVGSDGSEAAYDATGRILHDVVVAHLPAGWAWEGKRVLDFGCGAGRVLRHFAAEAEVAELWSCDIDAASIEWLNANLPVRGFVNAERPPLDRPDGSFDLVYAMSVFSHIGDEWSAWLLELHRVLAPDGVLIASFLGAGMCEAIAGEPWDEDRIGMNVLHAGRDWDRGGPSVLLSPWWIREHWGRAFAITALDPGAHGLIVARPLAQAPTRAELERIDPAEPREIAALRHNVRQLQREASDAQARLARLEAAPVQRVAARLRRALVR